MAARRASRPPVDWDALSAVVLPDLDAAGADALAPDEVLDGRELRGLDLADVRADGVRLLDCAVVACVVKDGRLRRARLSTCVLDDVRAVALDVGDARLGDVVVRGCRIGAWVADGAQLERVSVEGGRLDYVNLRSATLTQVQMVGCRIGELDLAAATVTDVRLVDCTVERLVLRGAVLDELDLRGAQVASLDGVESLRGAVVSEVQLALLAPALAAHVGLRVADA